jgi:hypothetical protein
MSRVKLALRMRWRRSSAPLKGPHNLFKAAPLGRRPNFGVGMAKGADQGRHLASRLDVWRGIYPNNRKVLVVRFNEFERI